MAELLGKCAGDVSRNAVSGAGDSVLSVGEMFALAGRMLPPEFDSIKFPGRIATDSRDVAEGSAFVALEGERVDGHDYVRQAEANGASLVIVRRGKRPDGLSVPCIELDDPESDLADTASAYLAKISPRHVVAVTGSVGKTTTREAIRAVLSGHFRLHAAVRSLNTRIGCSATVLTMPTDTDVLLLEFGASRVGDIAQLTGLFPPTCGVITQIAPVHIESFGSIEGVLKGKMEITSSKRLERFVYCFDSALLRDAAKSLGGRVELCSVGHAETAAADGVHADIMIRDARFRMSGGVPNLTFTIAERGGRETAFSAPIWGEHAAIPLAFAVSVGRSLGISIEDCAEAVSGFGGLAGRGRIVELDGGRFVVDDAYNANPTSMSASLEAFLSLETDGRLAVLGEMREMGPESVRFHREMLPLLKRVENVVLVRDIWREAFPDGERENGFIIVPTWQEAMKAVRGIKWKSMLVKGSNTVGLQNIVAELERENAARTGTVR